MPIDEIEALQAENDRLREALSEKLIDSTMLKSIAIDSDGLALSAEGGICKIVADAFGQVLIDSKTENYVEAWFTSSEHPEVGQIVVTVKKESGQTPHQLRIAAEQASNRLRATLNQVKERIGPYTYGGSDYREPAVQAIALIDAAIQGSTP